ncbi:mitochondrial import inner membrane translocase subunit TIM44-like [Styela clava]|uniref:mitochondrial import inner membrane translocase subunit TIM44-like n=1 Tax=Styela clava TaxID=7725 RepID=UPI00193A18DD|nr:mitochondrial import inner membrane translocase subunit TIM44-like [Styela clava]
MWGAARGTFQRCAIPVLTACTVETKINSRNVLRPVSRTLAVSSVQFNSPKRGFLENFLDNLKQEYNKDAELKESIKKFRKEAQELEDSEALKKARQKYEEISRETGQGTDAVRETLGKIKSRVSEASEEISKTEFVKQASRVSEGISEAAKSATDSEAFKKVASGFDNITKGTGIPPSSLYRPPASLRMRNELQTKINTEEIEANEDATGVVMHKDSVWNQQWENFKNSKVGERISDLRMKYDESDNPMIRASRFITEKIGDVAGGVFGKTDVSEVMTEIAKMEPNFSAQSFLRFCRKELIPNILEAICQNEKEIVKDWCTEAPYTQLIFPITQAEQHGLRYHSRVIDLDHIDIAAATKVDQGPVLVISFQTQQIIYVQNSRGEVVEGDAEQVMRVYHVWALCRDLEEMNPRAAWRLIDQSMSATPMLL